MATRLERLEESLVKARGRIEEIETKITEERQKIQDNKEAELKKFMEQKEKFEKLYGALPDVDTSDAPAAY
jgi:predicted  nucleic acid-binding Zn-ribbon protein